MPKLDEVAVLRSYLLTRLLLPLLLLLPAVSREPGRVAAGGGTLTVMEPGAPDTLNPLLTRTAAGADASAPVFDSLVRLDGSGVFRPDLAMRWSHNIGSSVWTFLLNPRAHWHDGEPVTAADVAFTIRLVRDARFGASSTLGFDDIASVAIGDTHTLTITLHGSYAPFLALVGTTPVLPAHVLKGVAPGALRAYAPFNRHPIGSGPFTVAAITAGGRVIEEANADYFGGAPRLDRLVFTPAPSRQAALDAARRDGTTLLPPALNVTAADVAPLSHDRVARPFYSRSFAWTHLDLIAQGALSDPLVRRALAYATPRDVIIDRVLRGHGHICDGDQAPGTPAYEPALHNSYHYNPLMARAILIHDGYSQLETSGLIAFNGVPLTITLWADRACSTCAETLNLISKGWRTAGISSRIRLVPTGALFGSHGLLYNPARFRAPEYDAVLYTWVNGPDPDDSAYWTSNNIVTPQHPFGGNFIGYANARLDALAVLANIMPNGPGRFALYRRIQHLLTADEPDIFLYWADYVSVVPRRLHGYAPTPYNTAATWNAREWRL